MRPRSARLESLRLAAVEERIEAELALGRPRDRAAGARAPRRRSPASGTSRRAAHEGALRLRSPGRGVVRVPTRADLLRGELGISPSPELQALHQRILRQEPAAPPSGGTAPPDHPTPVPAPAIPTRDSGRSRRGTRGTSSDASAPSPASCPASARRRRTLASWPWSAPRGVASHPSSAPGSSPRCDAGRCRGPRTGSSSRCTRGSIRSRSWPRPCAPLPVADPGALLDLLRSERGLERAPRIRSPSGAVGRAAARRRPVRGAVHLRARRR